MIRRLASDPQQAGFDMFQMPGEAVLTVPPFQHVAIRHSGGRDALA
jgi:hypothetical protein